MNRSTTKSWIAACLFLFGAGPFLYSASAAEPKDQTLRYSVDYRGSDAGEIEVIVKRNDDGYQVTSISHLSLLASMFLQSHTIVSFFQRTDDGLVLQSGKEILTQTGETVRSFEVDAPAGNIRFSGGDPVSFDRSTHLDADSFPLGLVTSNAEALLGRRFLSVNPKRARLFEITDVKKDRVEVPAGAFEVWRIHSSVPGEPSRVFRLWLRVDGDQVPVRIETGREGKLTTMVLLP